MSALFSKLIQILSLGIKDLHAMKQSIYYIYISMTICCNSFGACKKTGTIDGPGRKVVTQQLSDQGIYLTDLRETGTQRVRKLSFRFGMPRKLPTGELAAATRQMATLLGAGLALDDALNTVNEQTDQPLLSKTFAKVREHVVQGGTLHEALAEHRHIFPDLFINMIQVGEDSGTLDRTMYRLADFLESQARMRARIQSALAYPLLMTLVGSGVLVFLFVFVIPKITTMLDELDRALPWPTLLLITLTDFLARSRIPEKAVGPLTRPLILLFRRTR